MSKHLTPELTWLVASVILTGVLWLPYIVDRMREQEADLYASTFLVPEMALLTLPPTLLIRKAVNEGRDFSVKYLWSLIYQLARWFRVSPTLMKYRLMGLGLVGETQGSIHVSRQLAFRGAVSW